MAPWSCLPCRGPGSVPRDATNKQNVCYLLDYLGRTPDLMAGGDRSSSQAVGPAPTPLVCSPEQPGPAQVLTTQGFPGGICFLRAPGGSSLVPRQKLPKFRNLGQI